jgi:hypothetical protein
MRSEHTEENMAYSDLVGQAERVAEEMLKLRDRKGLEAAHVAELRINQDVASIFARAIDELDENVLGTA